MNEDFKWLAENVHEWPKSAASARESLCKTGFYWRGDFVVHEDGLQITRAQWQAARDELSGKPSWDCVDGEWIAQDYDGESYSFDNEPYHGKDCWDDNPCYREKYGIGKVLGDWRNTLERRPVPACIRCDDEIAERDCDNRPVKQWRGPEDGLPPVGVECEYLNHITQTVDYCTVIAQHDGGVVIAVHEENLTYSYHHCAMTNQFRPIRTEEDKAVEEMLSLDCDPHEGMLSREDFCRKLYRENYRKQEESK